jgi:alkylation response protein AidB-like acyl-CoA dehydrogenase
VNLGLAQRYVTEHEPMLASFRSFVARELVPLAAQTCGKEPDELPEDVRRYVRSRSADLGYYAGDYPEHLGGQGMPFTTKVLLHDYAEMCGCPLASVALCNAEGPSPLLLSATPDQQQRYLEPLVRARLTRCLALTEADGGSDAFSLTTRAHRKGERWSLSGSKSFVSHADQADIALVYARTETPHGTWAPAVFVIDMRAPGVLVGQRYDGLAGEPVFELVLDKVDLGEDDLLGGLAGVDHGVRSGLAALTRGRLLVAGMCNGMAARALALGVDFAGDRVSFGTRIAQHQYVQEHVVSSRLALESARMLTLAATHAFDSGEDAWEAAALAKLAASEGAVSTVNRMFQVHGGTAWVRGHPLERLYRQVRVMTIIEGTSEVQKVIISHAMGLG